MLVGFLFRIRYATVTWRGTEPIILDCSAHFTDDNFSNFGLHQMGFAAKLILKDGAVLALLESTASLQTAISKRLNSVPDSAIVLNFCSRA